MYIDLSYEGYLLNNFLQNFLFSQTIQKAGASKVGAILLGYNARYIAKNHRSVRTHVAQ